MELYKFIFPIRKWWWLVLASIVIAIIFSSLSVLRQPTVYQARTTLMIGTTINDPNPSNNEFALGQQLAAAYVDLANRQIVRSATMKALNMDRLPDYIAVAVPNSQLIEIVVTDVDRERSQIIANELAAQLVRLSPTSPQPEDQGRQEFIDQQLDNLEVQIEETENEIENLQQELSILISAQQILDTQNQIFALQSKLNTMQDEYGDLLANSKQGAINTLTIIEYASTARPIGPQKGLTVLLAAAIGFALAVCEAYLLEFLDDTLKSADDVERFFSAPIIGHIFEQGDGKNPEARLYAADDLGQPIAEAYRALRTNIEISQATRPLKTILVTSPDIGDGKTSVAANLALSIAQREKDVVLLDVDLRRPSIHDFFELDNEHGLVDVIADGANISDMLRLKKDRKVAVLTSGGTPPNPTELLGSKKMDQLLSMFEEAADAVIIDGPPFMVADATVMASKVDGILLVVRPGHTRRSLARGAVEQIKRAGASVVGVVLNRIPLRDADFYTGKSNVYAYYDSNYADDREKTDLQRLKEALLPYANKVSKVMKPVLDPISPFTNKVGDFIKNIFEAVRRRFQT